MTRREITFLGGNGAKIIRDMQHMAAGVIPANPSPEVSRGPGGHLRVRVSDATLAVLAGNAELEEPSGAEF